MKREVIVWKTITEHQQMSLVVKELKAEWMKEDETRNGMGFCQPKKEEIDVRRHKYPLKTEMYKGLFHEWSMEGEAAEFGPVALVEKNDGTMDTPWAGQIQFTTRG